MKWIREDETKAIERNGYLPSLNKLSEAQKGSPYDKSYYHVLLCSPSGSTVVQLEYSM